MLGLLLLFMFASTVVAPNKVLSEGIAHSFEAWADIARNSEAVVRRCTDDDFGFGHIFCDHAACSISLKSCSARQFQIVER